MKSIVTLIGGMLLLLGVQGQVTQVWLVVDTVYTEEQVGTFGTVEAGSVVYDLYLELMHSDDKVSTMYGDTTHPMLIETTTSFFVAAELGIAPNNYELMSSLFPEIRASTRVGVNNDQSECSSQNIYLISSEQNDWVANLNDGQSVNLDDFIGGGWGVEAYADQGCNEAGDDLLVWIGRFTTTGVFSGVLNVQSFIHGIPLDYDLAEDLPFGPDSITEFGCTDSTAGNYNPNAQLDDGSCAALGDLNGDGMIDIDDLLDFLGSFGCADDCGPVDLNDDGIVNILDLLILLGML